MTPCGLLHFEGVPFIMAPVSPLTLSHAFVPNGESGTPDSLLLTSVLTHETSLLAPIAADPWWSEPLPVVEQPLTSFQAFRHGNWHHLRARTRQAMIKAGLSEKTIQRFDDCGAHCHFWHSPSTNQIQIRGDFCRCRDCAPCANARSSLIRSNLLPFVSKRQCRFLTLTLAHKTCTLGQMVTRIWRCFATMRREGSWSKYVAGFVAFLEAKPKPNNGGYHIHLHVIAEGMYFPHDVLKNDWFTATGDSYIVDIQKKGSPEQMANYGAKYASKPINAADMETSEQFADAIFHLKGRHLHLIGGSWKGKLKLYAKPPDPADWEYIESANAVYARAAAGDAFSLQIITELSQRGQTPNTS